MADLRAAQVTAVMARRTEEMSRHQEEWMCEGSGRGAVKDLKGEGHVRRDM